MNRPRPQEGLPAAFLSAILSLMRYFWVQVGGLVLDLGIAWLAIRAGASDPVAALAGIVPSTLATFAVHEAWTFRGLARHGRARRLAAYVGLGVVAYVVRAACLLPLSLVLPGDGLGAAARLVIAAGISFGVGYALARTVVFRPDGTRAPKPDVGAMARDKA